MYDDYEGLVGFGLDRETDEFTLTWYLQKFSDDDHMALIRERLSEEDLKTLFDLLGGLLKKYLSEQEYHRVAVLATVFNYNLQAVVISDGFGFHSQYNVPALREIVLKQVQLGEPARAATQDLGTKLAQMVRRWRPELDVYLTTDRDVASLSGSDEAAPIRRVFYGVEEPMEIHLAILDGIKDRYDTPYFDNLKKYASRPIGTFHALPIARGKSIFKSNWIRDMGEFYGMNLFLAESSATTGGLDSLLEPTGNIKVAQDKAAAT